MLVRSRFSESKSVGKQPNGGGVVGRVMSHSEKKEETKEPLSRDALSHNRVLQGHGGKTKRISTISHFHNIPAAYRQPRLSVENRLKKYPSCSTLSTCSSGRWGAPRNVAENAVLSVRTRTDPTEKHFPTKVRLAA